MKIRVVFAVATFLPSSLICLPLRAADSTQSDAERLKILESSHFTTAWSFFGNCSSATD
jgi:hypothetical protein